ncbi:MAG: TetR/AcrR family transcriptional regulator [Acidimicrobiaceae bacterium]|nr:TetR/AcrR family transcriptional regulator [Acidimicrobiaceae bacterium]
MNVSRRSPPSIPVNPTRSPLLRAVLALCAQRGYAAVTVQEIANHAGVGRKAFYTHFADKRECFLAAYEEASEQLLGEVIGAAHAEEDWCTGLRAGVVGAIRVAETDATRMRCLLVEVFAAGEGALDRRARMLRRLALELDRARHYGSPAALAAPVSEIVIGGLESLLRSQLETGRPETAVDLIPDLVYFAVDPYLGKEIAAEQAELSRDDAEQLRSNLADLKP